MVGLIRDLKKFEEFSWLKAFDSVASQQVARDLDVALKHSFTKGRLQQFPTCKVSFKQKKLHDDSFRCVNNFNCIRIEKGAISIPKMGKVPIILHQKLASRIKTATIQFKYEKWSISLTHSSSRMQERKTSAIKACRVRYQQSAHPCWL
jgi:putative transposase